MRTASMTPVQPKWSREGSADGDEEWGPSECVRRSQRRRNSTPIDSGSEGILEPTVKEEIKIEVTPPRVERPSSPSVSDEDLLSDRALQSVVKEEKLRCRSPSSSEDFIGFTEVDRDRHDPVSEMPKGTSRLCRRLSALVSREIQHLAPIKKGEHVHHLVNAEDPSCSNWLRRVNCARSEEEQNLVAFQYRGQIYFRTSKPIPRGSELLVYYGDDSARELTVHSETSGETVTSSPAGTSSSGQYIVGDSEGYGVYRRFPDNDIFLSTLPQSTVFLFSPFS
ncbi:Histone-lysine N-methyltransferase PRDM9 [Amphibalanus amphitrite]|uniref:Histone-lysine N-methyltransferase PRDM9 n=1 Tax=Amphibalanus amphitrite TaxID=1232801 RepID=A0A6A4VEM7_AMPAM|nr:Histone-lysine N-methyltransferase PRDM9 [Amphibalanus amphitrite]